MIHSKRKLKPWYPGYCAFQADDEIRIYARAHGDREAIDRCKTSIKFADEAIKRMIRGEP
jgi:hypothetical protein